MQAAQVACQAQTSLLLLPSAIIVLSLVLGVAIHSIDHALRQRKRMGYYHMFKELREEILLLGLISLLLSIIQVWSS